MLPLILKADEEFYKHQANSKLYLTELMNTIFSMNHQVLNLLLVDYFDKDIPADVLENIPIDKKEFFGMRTDREIVKYINNEFDLIQSLEKEIEGLDSQLAKVQDFAEESQDEFERIAQEQKHHVNSNPGALSVHDLTMNRTISSKSYKMYGSQFLSRIMRSQNKSHNDSSLTVPAPKPMSKSMKDYREKVEAIREFCKKVLQHGLQSRRWQEVSIERFEELVEEAKKAEEKEWTKKSSHKDVLRDYKDSIARVKERLQNLYTKRYQKDLDAFKVGDSCLLLLSQQIKRYSAKMIQTLRDKSLGFTNPNYQKEVNTEYLDGKHESKPHDILEYNPDWPPFRDHILDKKEFFGKKGLEKLYISFDRLFESFRRVIKHHSDGINKEYFDILHNYFIKLDGMVNFLLKRLEPLYIIEEDRRNQDTHKMSLVYIKHYERLVRILKEIHLDIFAEGPIAKYLAQLSTKTVQSQSRIQELHNNLEDLYARFKDSHKAYDTQEFWSDLAMRVYRFATSFFSFEIDNNYIKPFSQAFTKLQDKVLEFEHEIVSFNTQVMNFGFSNDFTNINLNKVKYRQYDIQEINDYLLGLGDYYKENENLVRLNDSDNKDFDKFLNTKYQDTRQILYQLYSANKFKELFRVEPENNHAKVTFMEDHEVYYLNIPYYFQKPVSEETLKPKTEAFAYLDYPKAVKKASDKPLEHLVEDQPLKDQLDRDFHYFSERPDAIQWKPSIEKFFPGLTMEEFINIFLRDRNIKYQNKFYRYIDQIVLTKEEGNNIIEERAPVVSNIEDSMKKGFGYSKYKIKTERQLPFPIPFTDGKVTSESEINLFLLSPKHCISLVKATTEGIPTSDAFLFHSATDITERTNGVEVKWSTGIKWLKSTFLKSLIENKAPEEAKRSFELWSEVADDILKNNDIKKDQEKPDEVVVNIGKANYETNPVFKKSIDELNQQAENDRLKKIRNFSAPETFGNNFQFDKAKERAVDLNLKANEHGSSINQDDIEGWDLIPKPAKPHNIKSIVDDDDDFDKDQSFEGKEFVTQVDELDTNQKRNGLIGLGMVGLGVLFKMFL